MVAASAWAESPTTSLRPVGRDDDLYKQAIPNVSEIIADSGISGTVAFAVVDVESGVWLEASNATDGIPPASSIKAITALYALDQLGPDHVFETRLLATGGVVNGEVQGDLILVGGGDPTLDSDDLGQMAEELKEAGIIGVKGTFKVYEGAFPATFAIDPEQPDHVGYNPGVSGIALNYNRVHFEWKRSGGGYDVTMEGRAGRYAPAVRAATMEVVDRSGPVYTYENKPDRDVWTVAKSALGSGGARWLPIRRPGVYAGDIFATIARSHGIKLGDAELAEALPEGETLVTHRSAKLRPILKDMLEYSTNATAEIVGLSATARAGNGVPDGLKMSAGSMNAWLNATKGTRAAKLEDHSGLGDDSRISAADMVRAMVATGYDGELRPLLKPFRVNDRNDLDVAAKTGTLNFVSALTGFLNGPAQPPLAFAIFCSNVDRRDALPMEQRERPEGGRAWLGRARTLQRSLLERWATVYSG